MFACLVIHGEKYRMILDQNIVCDFSIKLSADSHVRYGLWLWIGSHLTTMPDRLPILGRQVAADIVVRIDAVECDQHGHLVDLLELVKELRERERGRCCSDARENERERVCV